MGFTYKFGYPELKDIYNTYSGSLNSRHVYFLGFYSESSKLCGVMVLVLVSPHIRDNQWCMTQYILVLASIYLSTTNMNIWWLISSLSTHSKFKIQKGVFLMSRQSRTEQTKERNEKEKSLDIKTTKVTKRRGYKTNEWKKSQVIATLQTKEKRKKPIITIIVINFQIFVNTS